MIWGYPYFRKQPYNDFVSSLLNVDMLVYILYTKTSLFVVSAKEKQAGLTSNSRSDMHVTHQKPTKKALSLQVSLWCLEHLLQSMTNPQLLDADSQNLSNALVHLLDEQSHIQTFKAAHFVVDAVCCAMVTSIS